MNSSVQGFFQSPGRQLTWLHCILLSIHAHYKCQGIDQIPYEVGSDQSETGEQESGLSVNWAWEKNTSVNAGRTLVMAQPYTSVCACKYMIASSECMHELICYEFLKVWLSLMDLGSTLRPS